MKNIIRILFWATSISILISCHFQQQEIILKPETKSQLAFVCELRNDYFFQYIPFITYTNNIGQPINWNFNYGDTLSRTPIVLSPINSPYYLNFISGAKVEIFEDGKFFRKLDSSYFGQYTIRDSVHFNYSKEYTLKVFKEGYDTVIGKQIFPRSFVMDTNKIKLNQNNSINPKYGIALSKLIFEINDTFREKTAFTFHVYIDNFSTDEKDKIADISQPLTTYQIDENSFNDRLISDSMFNGQKYFWQVGVNLDSRSFRNQFPIGKNQKLSLSVYFKSTSPDYILYLKSIANNGVSSSNPTTEPTSPYFNMKGGAGLFIASGKEYIVRIPVNY